MAGTKNCPTCGTEAPTSAGRCKSCFHDFGARKQRSFAPLILVAIMMIMPYVAGLVFFLMGTGPTDTRVLVDDLTQSIVIITRSRAGFDTERVPFGEVLRLEHVAEGGQYEIVAVTKGQDRKTIGTSGGEQLYAEAERYGLVMNKPVERTGSDEAMREEAAEH